MKRKIFYITLFIIYCNYSNAQQKQDIDSLDITLSRGTREIRNVVIYLPDANRKDIPVNIIMDCPESIYKSSGITISKINNLLFKSFLNALYSCENKYTFVAKEIELIYYSKCDVWLVTTEFTAQNDYGVIQEGQKSSFFNLKDYSEISILDLPCITKK